MSTQNSLGTAGANKTGVSRDPDLSLEMITGMDEFPPSSTGDGQEAARLRITVAGEGGPFASMPPATAKIARKGETLALLIDKLGERLQFERSGVRLYAALISKLDAYGTFPGGPSRGDLVEILEDEREHFELLWNALRDVGADPTVMTPSAAFAATSTRGIASLCLDPRTNLLQCLEAALVIELTDNECWDALLELAENAGMSELARLCEQALANEQEHLDNVRRWAASGQGRDPDRALREEEEGDDARIGDGERDEGDTPGAPRHVR